MASRGSITSLSAAALLFSAAVAMALASWLASLELARAVAELVGSTL